MKQFETALSPALYVGKLSKILALCSFSAHGLNFKLEFKVEVGRKGLWNSAWSLIDCDPGVNLNRRRPPLLPLQNGELSKIKQDRANEALGKGWGVKFLTKCGERTLEPVLRDARAEKETQRRCAEGPPRGREQRPTSLGPDTDPGRPTYRRWAASRSCRRRCPRPRHPCRNGWRRGAARGPGPRRPLWPRPARVAMELRQCGRRAAGSHAPLGAPRGRGRYAVWPRPSSFGPGAGPAANGCGTTGAQTPALPPLGPWRRIALRARTSWGLVPVVTAAQACSPRTSSRTSSAHTVQSKKRPAPSGCGDGGPSG